MVKVVIDAAYEHLRSYIEAIPAAFERVGNTLESRRNVIKDDHVQGVHLVIKSYRRIYLTNQIRYSFFAPSKAQRAFDNAIALLQQGFRTPKPIAYIEVRRNGLIKQSYFVCEYTSLTSLKDFVERNPQSGIQLMRDLARFTFSLHEKELYHVDYNVGNLLVVPGSAYGFELIDNNRMKFGPVSYTRGIRNMVKLGLPNELLTLLIREYALLSKRDPEVSVKQYFDDKNKELRRRQMKHSLKALVGIRKRP